MEPLEDLNRSMEFKGDILITDPCYIIDKSKENDWDESDYGQNMEALGINNYFTESTLCGDWSCDVFKIAENPYDIIDKFAEASENGDDYDIDVEHLGEFGADSGLVSVFDLNEVRKYNPNIDEWVKAHNWCATIIPNFDGEVSYYVDKEGMAHVLGVGNINFFTD